ncbi:MAG: hypothetical protein HUU15_19735, partial [Candidatus Brocadiae bacterium]|nr:hypothetical protein [Candidatus Brocadiia bacterium]
GPVDRLASRPLLASGLAGLASFAGAALWAVAFGPPEPVIQDEFAYLMAGETYAAGRLTNPTHPMWMHFESMHIFHRPTMMAKYPPAQGLVLAAGFLLGDPAIGVWLSIAAACAAVTWMLFAWLPPRWAVIGGALCVARLGIAGYWAQSYWGGAVAMAGGALLYGAARRLAARPTAGNGVAFACGLALLANSRPFEGLVAAIPACAIVAGGLWRGRAELPRWLARVALPAAAILAVTGAAMMHNNRVVTGSATRLPYFVHNDEYTVISQFAWQAPRPVPAYRHPSMRRFYEGHELPYHARQRTVAGFLAELPRKLHLAVICLFGGAFVFVVPAIGALWRHRWRRWALGAFALEAAAIGGLTIVMTHYAAPTTCLGWVLGITALRVFHAWRLPGRAGGAFALPLAAALAFFGLGWQVSIVGTGMGAWGKVRAHVLQTLEDEPGRDVVIVRYGPRHLPDFEWVYNHADIDGAEVVWARDMGPERNAQLRAYWPDRTAWVLDVDRDEDEPLLTRVPR